MHCSVSGRKAVLNQTSTSSENTLLKSHCPQIRVSEVDIGIYIYIYRKITTRTHCRGALWTPQITSDGAINRTPIKRGVLVEHSLFSTVTTDLQSRPNTSPRLCNTDRLEKPTWSAGAGRPDQQSSPWNCTKCPLEMLQPIFLAGCCHVHRLCVWLKRPRVKRPPRLRRSRKELAWS